MDADLTSFLKGRRPCVGASGKHHARLIRECRWKSTTVVLQTGCDAVGNRRGNARYYCWI